MSAFLDWCKLFASCIGGMVLVDVGSMMYLVLKAGLFGVSPIGPPDIMMPIGFAFGGLMYLNSKMPSKEERN